MFNRVEQLMLREMMEKWPEILRRLDELSATGDKSEADLDFFHSLRDSVVKDKADGNKKSG